MPALIATLAQIGALILKELLAIIKEPSSRVILFAPALMQALLFGYGATYDLNHAPYAVLDQSRSAASTELLARLDGAGVFTRAATLTSSDQIASQIDAGKALMVISIPCRLPGPAGGRAARAAASHPGRPHSSTAGVAGGYLASIVADFNARHGAQAPAWPWNGAPGTTQPGIALDPDARPDRRAEHAADPAAGRAVGGASASRAPSTSCWSRRSRPCRS